MTGVVGRAELLASLGFLSAILAYEKAAQKTFPRKTKWTYLFATLMATTLAMLCKEQGITVLAVCVVFEVCVRHKVSVGLLWTEAGNSSYRGLVNHALGRLAFLTLGGLGLLLFRLRLMGATLPVFTRFDNPAASPMASGTTKVLTFSYLASLNVWLLLAPCDLLCDWTMNTVPLVSSLADLRNVATLALASFILILVWWIVVRQQQRQRGTT